MRQVLHVQRGGVRPLVVEVEREQRLRQLAEVLLESTGEEVCVGCGGRGGRARRGRAAGLEVGEQLRREALHAARARRVARGRRAGAARAREREQARVEARGELAQLAHARRDPEDALRTRQAHALLLCITSTRTLSALRSPRFYELCFALRCFPSNFLESKRALSESLQIIIHSTWRGSREFERNSTRFHGTLVRYTRTLQCG